MTALLIASIASNVLLLWAAVYQRHRLRSAAVARCKDCPVAAAPLMSRIPVPVYDEPPTVILRRAPAA